jgi:hypothetical protein
MRRRRLGSSVRCEIAFSRVATWGTLLVLACTDQSASSGVVKDAPLRLATTALTQLDPARDGWYHFWAVDAAGAAHHVAAFRKDTAADFLSPADHVVSFIVTLEPQDAVAAAPSNQVLLRGKWGDERAELSVVGAITQGDILLRERPGQFTMFTPSDNETMGYPSREEAGVWVFNMEAAATEQNDFYVRVAQLEPGWTYEGWMVRDYGSGHEIWLSYGKFLPDATGALNQPDDTGWGPFSGVPDFRNSRLEDFPGDDWISNPLGFPFPSELTLPLNLREKDSSGALRWTHVITIEPVSDKGESIGSERPFVVRPYVDPFGDLNPGVARTITYRPQNVPRGQVVRR